MQFPQNVTAVPSFSQCQLTQQKVFCELLILQEVVLHNERPRVS